MAGRKRRGSESVLCAHVELHDLPRRLAGNVCGPGAVQLLRHRQTGERGRRIDAVVERGGGDAVRIAGANGNGHGFIRARNDGRMAQGGERRPGVGTRREFAAPGVPWRAGIASRVVRASFWKYATEFTCGEPASQRAR